MPKQEPVRVRFGLSGTIPPCAGCSEAQDLAVSMLLRVGLPECMGKKAKCSTPGPPIHDDPHRGPTPCTRWHHSYLRMSISRVLLHRTSSLRPYQRIQTLGRHLHNMPAFLNQKDAQQLDVDLMSEQGGFKLEQVIHSKEKHLDV